MYINICCPIAMCDMCWDANPTGEAVASPHFKSKYVHPKVSSTALCLRLSRLPQLCDRKGKKPNNKNAMPLEQLEGSLFIAGVTIAYFMQ